MKSMEIVARIPQFETPFPVIQGAMIQRPKLKKYNRSKFGTV